MSYVITLAGCNRPSEAQIGEQKRAEVFTHLEDVAATKRFDAKASAYLDEVMASKDFVVQARAVPLLAQALEQGAVTSEYAASRIAQMKARAKGDEVKYWQFNEERFRSHGKQAE